MTDRAGDDRELVPFGVARRAGEARADSDVLRAIVEARAKLTDMPEYVTLIDDSSGKHINLPMRATASGMLAWIERHYARTHPDPPPKRRRTPTPRKDHQ